MSKISLRIDFGDKRLGPGKIELLERIDQLGSIAAAGRSLGMSYKRAWLLIAQTDEIFGQATLEKQQGGKDGGGARLTELGKTLVREFRSAEERATQAISNHIELIDKQRLS